MLAAPPDTIEEMRSRGLGGDARLTDLFLRNVALQPERTALVDAPNRRSFTDGEPKRPCYRELVRQARLLADRRRERGVAIYKLPERLCVVDRLPRNPLNEIARHERRALAAGRRSPAVHPLQEIQ